MASLTFCLEHAVKPNAFRSYLAKFFSTFLNVLAAVGSARSSTKMILDAATDPSALVTIPVANAFALSVAVYTTANISGQHMNPAVTFGMAVWGRITVPMDFFIGFHRDPRRGQLGAIGPLAIGFIIEANVMASRPFTSGSMNSAYSFGSALVGGSFKNHVVY
ncbi:hypothetical protein ACSBR2_035529 [Camellia fascicularis]